MHSEQDKRLDRRELLRGIVRGVGVAGVAAVAAILGRRALLGGEGSCDRKGICRGCWQVQLCALPQAVSFRDERKDFNAAPRAACAETVRLSGSALSGSPSKGSPKPAKDAEKKRYSALRSPRSGR